MKDEEMSLLRSLNPLSVSSNLILSKLITFAPLILYAFKPQQFSCENNGTINILVITKLIT
jgi:hypothetical protein